MSTGCGVSRPGVNGAGAIATGAAGDAATGAAAIRIDGAAIAAGAATASRTGASFGAGRSAAAIKSVAGAGTAFGVAGCDRSANCTPPRTWASVPASASRAAASGLVWNSPATARRCVGLVFTMRAYSPAARSVWPCLA